MKEVLPPSDEHEELKIKDEVHQFRPEVHNW
jgi:hypothetical protein